MSKSKGAEQSGLGEQLLAIQKKQQEQMDTINKHYRQLIHAMTHYSQFVNLSFYLQSYHYLKINKISTMLIHIHENLSQFE